MKIIFKTKSWCIDNLKNEVSKYFKTECFKELTSTLVEIERDKFDIENMYDFLYYSRFCVDFYLFVDKFEKIAEYNTISNKDLINNKFNLNYSVDFKSSNTNYLKNNLESHFGSLIKQANKNFKVNLDKPDIVFEVEVINSSLYLLLKLNKKPIYKRDYKINTNSNSINSIVVNYLLDNMDIDLSKDISFIDPLANLGDMIIESSYYVNKNPLNIRDRFVNPISSFFGIDGHMPKKKDSYGRFTAVVQNNKIFKDLKENLNFSKNKVRPSQFELDWLDVKFEKDEFKYAVSLLPSFRDLSDYDITQDSLFYQLEHIISDKIGIISRSELDKSILKKHKIKQISSENVLVGEQNYFIYILGF